MQRRKFTQLVFSGFAVGLGACASPAANQSQSSAPATAPPQKAEAAKTEATQQKQPTQAAKPAQPTAAAPTAESVAAVLIQPTTPPEPLPDGPIAPYIESDTWLNVAQPIAWDSLRGTVTMVEFWTYG
jgi:hypothetical protein